MMYEEMNRAWTTIQKAADVMLEIQEEYKRLLEIYVNSEIVRPMTEKEKAQFELLEHLMNIYER